MAVRMATLTRDKNGNFVSRKGIPADVRDAYTRLYRAATRAPLRVTKAGRGPTAPKVWEELFKLPSATAPSAAKVAWLEWCAEIDTRVATLRAASNGVGRPLTRLNAQGLAGKWYGWWIKQHENDPRSSRCWARARDHLQWEVIGREAPDEYKRNTDADPHWEWANAPEVREKVRPVVAEMARTASFLASAGISLNADAHKLFTDAVSDLLYQALSILEQRADGDHTPDETPKSFPRFDEGSVEPMVGPSCWDLFEGWVRAAQRAGGSVRRARGVFMEMQARFVHTGAGALTAHDAKAWIDGLITEERSAFTVKNVWLSASKAVFNWAVDQQLIANNPFATVKVARQKRRRDRVGKTFTKQEVSIILSACQRIADPRTPLDRAKRWVPWLCAYTGARPGEMTQLRSEDIKKMGENYFAHLTPAAGTIKSGQARVVPLHEHLVELGFIDFVRARGPGPMFYKPSKSKTVLDPLNPKRGPAVKARENLGEWVREVGVKDTELSPSHAWRHTFLSKARQAGIEESLRFGITGHTQGSVGRSYGEPEPDELAEALKRFPRYEFHV